MGAQKNAGALAGIAAIVAAAAGFGPSLVAWINVKQSTDSTRVVKYDSKTEIPPTRADSSFSLLRGESVSITNPDGTFRVRLLDVETLKKSGKSRDKLSGIDFNRSLPNARRLIGGVLVRSGVDTSSVLMDHVMAMGQPEWTEFVETHPADHTETVKAIPFARISVESSGAEKAGAFYLKGDTLGAGRSRVIVEEVVNTKKSSGSPERASFRIVFH